MSSTGASTSNKECNKQTAYGARRRQMFQFIAWDSSQLKSVHIAHHLSSSSSAPMHKAIFDNGFCRCVLHILAPISDPNAHKSKIRSRETGPDDLINNLVRNNYA